MGMKIDSNPDLIVVSIDEKWATVTCKVCGTSDKLRRTEIYTLNRDKKNVICGFCKFTKEQEDIIEEEEK